MVVDHQPFEAVGVKIQLVQRFMMPVGMVQVAHQPLDAVVPVVAALQQMPVEANVMVPLAALSELIAHKQQLFPREGEQPAVVGAQVGELLPGIAGMRSRIDFLPCTTSSWESGSTKFSV